LKTVEEAQTQAIKATRVGRYLRDIIWQNKMISTKSKPRMYVQNMRKTYFNILRRNQSWNINNEKNNENHRNENTKNYLGGSSVLPSG